MLLVIATNYGQKYLSRGDIKKNYALMNADTFVY